MTIAQLVNLTGKLEENNEATMFLSLKSIKAFLIFLFDSLIKTK